MELGGVLAVANMRGGGEYGEEWHLAGKTRQEAKRVRRFHRGGRMADSRKAHDVATSSRSWAAATAACLVGAVEVQRPDLFGACIPMVGVMDMLRFQEFTAGQFWRDEFGYIEKEDEFKALLAYSPYHNIKEGTHYPPTLIMTADTDDRVVPMHSFKFAAAMQRAQSGRCADPAADRNPSRPRRTARRSRSRSKNAADRWAFLVKELRMEAGEAVDAESSAIEPQCAVAAYFAYDRLRLCTQALAAAGTTRFPAESSAARPSHRTAREANRGTASTTCFRRTRAGGDEHRFASVEPRRLQVARAIDEISRNAALAGQLGQPLAVRAVLAAENERHIGLAGQDAKRPPGDSAWRSRCRPSAGPRSAGTAAFSRSMIRLASSTLSVVCVR